MPPMLSRRHSAWALLIPLPPQAGETRALNPSGVDGVGCS